jgi:ABC-2 type transport system permease protein
MTGPHRQGETAMKSLWTTLRYTFVQLRGQILGWGIGLGLLGLLLVSFYGVFGAQQERFQQLIESYPPEFLAFFGGDTITMLTPAGYLKMYAFSMLPLIIGIFAVVVGSGLLASDEEHGRLDLILAHPVGRGPLFFGRCLGMLAAVMAALFLGLLGFCILLPGSGLEVRPKSESPIKPRCCHLW